MKFSLKQKGSGFKALVVSGLLLATLNGIGQDRSAVIADPKLGNMELYDFDGHRLDVNNLRADQLLKLKVPVACDNHGKILPAGSCKIKIALGSKLVLDPGFNITDAGMSNYFKWTATENAGELLLAGELINPLPVNVNAFDLSFRLKVKEEGNSAVTANFLITNHNTVAVLSDENGTNNASAIAYKVGTKLPNDPAAVNGNLKLSVFPNPAKNVTAVNISVLQGSLVGKYKISMYDMAGKLVQAKDMQLNLVSNFTYDFGLVASGKYLIKVINSTGTETTVLKFEKL